MAQSIEIQKQMRNQQTDVYKAAKAPKVIT